MLNTRSCDHTGRVHDASCSSSQTIATPSSRCRTPAVPSARGKMNQRRDMNRTLDTNETRRPGQTSGSDLLALGRSGALCAACGGGDTSRSAFCPVLTKSPRALELTERTFCLLIRSPRDGLPSSSPTHSPAFHSTSGHCPLPQLHTLFLLLFVPPRVHKECFDLPMTTYTRAMMPQYSPADPRPVRARKGTRPTGH